MIEIRSISKQFNNQEIIHDLSLTLEDGKTYVVTGESGKGKTTFLRILSGLEKPDSGSVIESSSQANVTATDEETNHSKSSKAYQQKGGMLFQEDRLFENFTAVENLKAVMAKSSHKAKKLEGIIRTELSALLDTDKLDRPVKTLSGGEKRRVAIVRAFVTAENLVILDEPLTGLDEKTMEVVKNYIKEKSEDKTVVITDHDGKNFQGTLIQI